jgi:hypothetical protein
VTATSGSVTATVQALAVETAGGLQATPPPTDTVDSGANGAGPSNAGQSAVLILIAAGSLTLAMRNGLGRSWQELERSGTR